MALYIAIWSFYINIECVRTKYDDDDGMHTKTTSNASRFYDYAQFIIIITYLNFYIKNNMCVCVSAPPQHRMARKCVKIVRELLKSFYIYAGTTTVCVNSYIILTVMFFAHTHTHATDTHVNIKIINLVIKFYGRVSLKYVYNT